MLVYADRSEKVEISSCAASLSAEVDAIGRMPTGLKRHAKLVAALVEAGRLQQGIADASLPDGHVGIFVHRLAACVVRSLDSDFADTGRLPAKPPTALNGMVDLKVPEGFAFYAVYPESYAQAARRVRLLGLPRVIGIRSIGTTLGAIAAAALGAPVPITVRPSGDPFRRSVELPPEAVEDGAHYIIVDEGPGLSGSSFGVVADALEHRGVPLDRIAFLPSHDGDLGPEASDLHQVRWSRAQRVAAGFEPRFLRERFGSLRELAIGGRLKFVASISGRAVLLKFAGLGKIGERKLAMARALHGAGLTPEPLGLVHGFLVERWCEGAVLGDDDKPVAEIGRYVGARATLFHARENSGASTGQLLAMCRRNIALAFGDELACAIDQLAVPAAAERVRTDNRLDRAKWLRLPCGRLLKTDALDHHQDHDLVGCQPVEWDLAGAMVEFDLSEDEASELAAAAGVPFNQIAIRFFQVAYAAFRLGQTTLAQDGRGDRYQRHLRGLLQARVVA